jgi:hypothetical protein
MAPKNFYALVRSRAENPTIFCDLSWDDVKPLVIGFRGSNIKGFTTLSDAEEYMRSNNLSTWSKLGSVEPSDNPESLPPVLETDSNDETPQHATASTATTFKQVPQFQFPDPIPPHRRREQKRPQATKKKYTPPHRNTRNGNCHSSTQLSMTVSLFGDMKLEDQH